MTGLAILKLLLKLGPPESSRRPYIIVIITLGQWCCCPYLARGVDP